MRRCVFLLTLVLAACGDGDGPALNNVAAEAEMENRAQALEAQVENGTRAVEDRAQQEIDAIANQANLAAEAAPAEDGNTALNNAE